MLRTFFAEKLNREAQKIFPTPGHLTVNFSPASGALDNTRSFALYSYWEYVTFSVPGPPGIRQKNCAQSPGTICNFC